MKRRLVSEKLTDAGDVSRDKHLFQPIIATSRSETGAAFAVEFARMRWSQEEAILFPPG